MKLIFGLGNPGLIYRNSRHNIGSSIVKALSQRYKIALKRTARIRALSGQGFIGTQKATLALPLEFMNLCGAPLAGLLKKFKLDPADLLVVCDDLDLEFGRMKIRPGGSSGGHRGLESIIGALGTRNFARLRVGIGRPPHPAVEPARYVLSNFKGREKARLGAILNRAADCCACWAEAGITESMNLFNGKDKPGDEDE